MTITLIALIGLTVKCSRAATIPFKRLRKDDATGIPRTPPYYESMAFWLKLEASQALLTIVQPVQCIGDNDPRPNSRVAYKLYKFLWKQPQNLKQIIDVSREVVPDIQTMNRSEPDPCAGSDTQEVKTTQFVDLTKIPDFPQAEQSLFKKIRFLIRQEYNELDAFLDYKKCSNIALVGQPGIGSCVFFL